jgi:hypothetical protein
VPYSDAVRHSSASTPTCGTQTDPLTGAWPECLLTIWHHLTSPAVNLRYLAWQIALDLRMAVKIYLLEGFFSGIPNLPASKIVFSVNRILEA